jgi:uncharacterized protein
MSDTPARQHSPDEEFDALAALCDTLAGFGCDVDVEWVDGFLAALVVGPRAVPPAEWLPVMFGDAFERAFADPEAAERALVPLQARRDAVAAQLEPARLLEDELALRYEPILIDWNDEARRALVAEGLASAEEAAACVTGRDWALGFLTAMRHFEADWSGERMSRDEQAALVHAVEHIVPLLATADVRDAAASGVVPRRRAGTRAPTRDDLVEDACFAVQDLRLLWLEHASRPQPRRAEVLPGRNDPCPCGSGRKFKKCHGAGVAP